MASSTPTTFPFPRSYPAWILKFNGRGYPWRFTGHLEADRIATNGWMLLFVDDVVLA